MTGTKFVRLNTLRRGGVLLQEVKEAPSMSVDGQLALNV
jgi:hypothetical protein